MVTATRRFHCSLALIALAPLVARAQAPAVDLAWSAPPECPQQDAVLGDIQRRTAELDESGRREDVRVVGRVVRLEPEYVLHLQTGAGGATTEREIRAVRCDELAGAAALIASLLVDTRGASEDEAPVAREEPAPPEAKPPSLPAGRTVESQPAGRAVESHVFVEVALVADAGTLPSIGVGPAAGFGWVFGALRAELFGLYLPTQEISVEGRSQPVGVLRLLTAGLGACYALLRVPALGPCLELEYGRIWGESRNVSDRGAGGTAWVLLAPGVRADFHIVAGLSLGVQVSAGFPLEQTSFSIAGIGPVHEVTAVVGRLRAGATWQF